MSYIWPHPLVSAQSPDPGVPMLGTVLPGDGVELVDRVVGGVQYCCSSYGVCGGGHAAAL